MDVSFATAIGRLGLLLSTLLLCFSPAAAFAQSEDLPRVTLSDVSAVEGEWITFVARLDKPAPGPRSARFNWHTRGQTATPGEDYDDYAYTAIFAPGASEAEIRILTFADEVPEEVEYFEVVFSGAVGLTLDKASVKGLIHEREPRVESSVPEVSVLGSGRVTEGEYTHFAVLASPRPTGPLAVSLTIGQSGNFAAHGETGARTVVVGPNGQTSFRVATSNDDTNEADGAVTAALNAGSGYTLSSNREYQAASVRVLDDDVPVVTLSAGSSIREGGTASFNLRASPRPASPFDVTVQVSEVGSSAASGQTGARTVTIGTNGRGRLTVRTDSDQVDEDDGAITARLVSGSGYLPGTSVSGQVAVTDGGPPTYLISISAPSSIQEGDTATFTLTASPRPIRGQVEVRVRLSEQGEFAAQGELGERTVTIDSSGSGSLTLATENDSKAESNGVLIATIINRDIDRGIDRDGYAPGSPSSAKVIVRDAAPQVSISAGPAINEGGTANFTLSADPRPQSSVEVEVQISEQGEFAAGGQLGTYFVAIGSDGQGALAIETDDDGVFEADGRITASLVSGTEYGLSAPSSASVTVRDTTPKVSIRAGPAVFEGDAATFTLTASPAPGRDIFVHVEVAASDGYQIEGGNGSQGVSIDSTGTATLELVMEDDDTDEADGSVSATVRADSSGTYGLGRQTSASVKVRDDDSTPAKVSISVGDASVQEGQGALSFPVTLSGPTGHVVTAKFELRTTSATSTTVPATPGIDYDADDSLLREWFTSGNTQGSVEVRIYDDDVHEEMPETFELIVASVSGADIADGRATGTILPDPNDAPRSTPTVTISAGSAITEGEPAEFTLRAVPAPRQDLTVAVAVYDDSSSGFVDPADLVSRSVIIPGLNDREANYYGDSVKRFTVPTIDDDVAEDSGQVRVVIESSGDGGYDSSAHPWEASVDVRDDDTPPPEELPALSVSDASAQESAGIMVFDITIDPPLPAGHGPVSVDYEILTWANQQGGAEADVDFVDTFGTLVFRVGDSVKQVEVTIIDDDHDEGNEQFNLYLLRVEGGAVFADRAGRGTIINSDPMPTAWLGRFGRALSEQTVDSISARLQAPRTSSVGGAGRGEGFVARKPFSEAGLDWDSPYDADRLPTRNAHLRTQFALTQEADARGGTMAFWGRGAHTSLGGREGPLAVDAGVESVTLGVDYARGNSMAGVAMTQSTARGDYGSDDTAFAGVRSSLTAAIPYAAWQASERLSIWGAAGYGAGEMSLETASEEALSADVDWTMLALGLRSELLSKMSLAGGPKLMLVSDVLSTRTSSEDVVGLESSEAHVSRFRLGLEGSWRIELPGRGSVTPSLDAGLRRDAGDLDTGFGVDVGAGLNWSDPSRGMSLDLKGRTLITHEAEGREEHGFSAALNFASNAVTRLGPSLTLRQESGLSVHGGLDAVFNSGPLGESPANVYANRWTTEVAYGLAAFGGRFTASPTLSFGVGDNTRDYSLAWRVQPAGALAPNLSLGLQATFREDDLRSAEHMAGLEITARW